MIQQTFLAGDVRNVKHDLKRQSKLLIVAHPEMNGDTQ